MGRYLLLFVFSLSILNCSGANFFEDFGDKTSDEARLFAAKQLINKGSFADAVTEFESMSAAFRAKREVAALYSSAYAGLCGLDFLSMISALEGLDSSRLFLLLMQTFTGATTTTIGYCINAQDILAAVSTTASGRTLDENLLMTFISFAKMGSIFSAFGDADANDTLDGGFDACNAGSIDETEVREVGSSMVHILASLTAVGSQSDIAGGALTDISTLLNSIAEVYDFCDDSPDGSGDCTNTDPADFDADQVRAIRTFMAEDQDLGLGSCSGDFTACLCP